jgi:hypothetical protein
MSTQDKKLGRKNSYLKAKLVSDLEVVLKGLRVRRPATTLKNFDQPQHGGRN